MLTKERLIDHVRHYDLEDGTLEALCNSPYDYPGCLVVLDMHQYDSLVKCVIKNSSEGTQFIATALYLKELNSYTANSPIMKAIKALANKYDYMSEERAQKEVEKIIRKHELEDKKYYAMFLAYTSVLLEAII